MLVSRIRTVLGLAMLSVVVGAAPARAQAAVDRPVTFHKDIEPILQRSCQRCHNPESVAPMSLITYEQVRPFARAIKQRTALKYAPWSRGVMPPWFLESRIGIQKIKDDVSLSDKEIAQSLVVTVRTVEVHLKHAYAKLGIRSRAQLAHRLSKQA